MKVLKNKKIVSVLLTLSVITILLLTGPASAVRLGIHLDNDEVTEGNNLDFTVSVDLEEIDSKEELINENSSMMVFIRENADRNIDEGVTGCLFDLAGNPLNASSCDGSFSIIANNNANMRTGDYFGYGYGSVAGYGYGPGYDADGNVYPPAYYYLNVSGFGPGYGSGSGYGYMPGYGYATEPYGELSYDISWKTPSAGTYYVDAVLVTPTAANESFIYPVTDMKQFTVNADSGDGDPDDGGSEDGGDDSTGGGGLPPPMDEEENKTVPAHQNILNNVIANKNVPDKVKEKLTAIAEKLQNIVTGAKSTQVFVGEEVNRLGNVMQLQEMMGAGPDDIESVMVNEMGEKAQNNAGMSDEIKDLVTQKLQDKAKGKFLNKVSNVKKKTKVTTVTTKDGETKSLVEVTYEVRAGDHVVEVPKTLAATASEIQGEFEVIEEDPILLFEGTDSIEMGFATDVEKVESVDSEADNVKIASLEEDKPVKAISTPTEETGEDGNATTPQKDDGGLGWLVGVLLLIVIIGAVAVVVYSRTRGNKPDFQVK
ncbi:MAG: hypothetical protein ACQESG_04835 [Nanobdellota archaeon]